MFSIGSLPNSGWNIESELLHIIMQNIRLDNLIYNQSDNIKLNETLILVKSYSLTRNLAIYDGFDFAKLYWFVQIFHHYLDDTITGNKSFSKEMLTLRKCNMSLPDDIYDLLVQYYNTAYDWKFKTIANAASDVSMSEDYIIILPNVNQYRCVHIRTKIFEVTITLWYLRNSYILAKITDIFFGEIQYYFEYTVKLLIGIITHKLAFIK